MFHVPVKFTRLIASTTVGLKPKTKLQKTDSQQQSVITCKRTQFNLLTHAPETSKFGTIPLASKGWLHNKSKGDKFTIHAIINEEELRSDMQALDVFLYDNNWLNLPYLVQNLNNEFSIKKLTNIQTNAMPIIYAKNHALIAAETGCGKTISYLLPIIVQQLERQQDVKERDFNTPTSVILTPGRELATQIAAVAKKLCKGTELKVTALLGGNTKQLMVNPNFEDVDILVATLGALSKLVTTGIYRMNQVRHVVLDEADTLLDDTFNDKLSYFLKRFPFHKNHMQDDHTVGTQLILASATMPTNTREILECIIDVETLHKVVSPNLHRLMPHVEQKFIRMSKADRPANLITLVKRDITKKRPIIIFSNKTATSDYVSIFLNNSGINCLNLNGDMLLKIRLGRFERFQSGECDVLSTTDVGSRGLDTTRVRQVINFDFPLHVSDYIHRCGRIGRIGSLHKSLVTNFISSRREISIVQRIEHAARTGGLLSNVNANIKNIINKHIMDEMKLAGLPVRDEAF